MKVLLVAIQVIQYRDYDGICLSTQVSLPRIRSQIFLTSMHHPVMYITGLAPKLVPFTPTAPWLYKSTPLTSPMTAPVRFLFCSPPMPKAMPEKEPLL